MKLNEKSVKALENLKNYPQQVDSFLSSKRSAVLIALLANSKGDLEVILTVRSTSLRTNAGDSAFPGGTSITTQRVNRLLMISVAQKHLTTHCTLLLNRQAGP